MRDRNSSRSGATATAIVVPTPAMAERLRRLAPDMNPAKIHHIPWGIPDHLLHQPLTPPPTQDRPFRLLYAGRLTAEKGLETLATTCAQTRHTTLSIAAPADEYARFADQLRKTGCAHHYLGWLDRHQLWDVFRAHDALAVPSTTLEAFGLVAVEAQACGLPVLYQPVPGLTDVLGDTALPVDFTDPHALTIVLRILQQDPSAHADLRTAGYGNARRFPISTTAKALIALGNQIA
ncbi:glycosyltransferase [Nonomuraea angiospora]|uniref:glycosyltransferase family 4 protein n=1 Tax=Nonomuraea angiospora TaxID=46172 RepID=UPI003442EC4F